MSDFSNQAWRDQVRSATAMTRAMTAGKATRISPSAMAEVLVALHDYWDALQSTELDERNADVAAEEHWAQSSGDCHSQSKHIRS